MSFCTSTTVSLVIVYFNNIDNHFFPSFMQRFFFAWPTVFFCILIFVPIINKQLDKYLK